MKVNLLAIMNEFITPIRKIVKDFGFGHDDSPPPNYSIGGKLCGKMFPAFRKAGYAAFLNTFFSDSLDFFSSAAIRDSIFLILATVPLTVLSRAGFFAFVRMRS